MTAPLDEARRADAEWCKRFGFNGARKHRKIEEPRWLNWCDHLGLLVWGELPFVSGFCYTQLTDIEQEINGHLTYDRRPKVDPE